MFDFLTPDPSVKVKVTDVAFIVKVATPVYHKVHDGFVGTRTVIDDAFGTYDEALQYVIENYNSHEVDYSDVDHPVAFITMFVTLDAVDGSISYGDERNVSDLTVNSHYTGACNCWPEHTKVCNFKSNPCYPF